MTDIVRRVALLARPGAASQRLAEVLDQAGVTRVLDADPTSLQLADLVAAQPEVVVVALDPVTEDALERFDAVLANPAVDVIYEEAVLTAAREGWDDARWRRHLVAKLLGRNDVLPPGAALLHETAIASTSPAASEDGRWAESLLESSSLTITGEEIGHAARSTQHVMALATPEPIPGLELEPIIDVSSEWAQEPSFEAEIAFTDDPTQAVAEQVFATGGIANLGGLTLVEDLTSPDEQAAAHGDRFKHDLADLELRISSMGLIDEAPVRVPEQPRGAVLVMAGIGGPDAVRQLLGALPGDFQRPVLVQQRLDGGRYDKLVAQMQRATTLPVQLAEAGANPAPGTIYILPVDLGVEKDGEGLCFAPGGDLLAALPAADSAVLLLSGSDPAQIDAVMNFGWAGGLVAGQSPDGCYDAAAPDLLATRGGITGTPVELAQRLATYWQH